MSILPNGTVTFLFTDIEGSTRLAQKCPEKWEDLRKRHADILQSAVDAQHGYVFEIIGDAFCAAFQTASDAVRSAVRSQIDLSQENWGVDPVKVRMGIHTGQAEIQEKGNYHGYLSMSRVQRLMSAAHGGQVLVSLAAQELVCDDLPENASLRDMGERRLKDLIRPEHVFQLVIAGLPVDFPPIKTLDAYRHNLPVQLTTFIGREKELAEIRQAIADHRLVTLTGAGGTGKTRLSLHAAADLLDRFPDGAWFVELAPLANPDLIPQTILSAFGIGDQPGLTSLQSLTDYLHRRKLLLVLDNCEHLVQKTAELATTLLTSAEDIRILATSREALGVNGELSWYVPSLSLPDINHLPAIEALSQYEAVSLFIDRAVLVQPHFTVTRYNAPAIAQICHRLDGIPLAIELAAARVKVLDVEQIARRLDDRFRLLTGGSRAALPRHQTLRAAIDWSYNLLSDLEKVLFRRLSVFTGGWTLEAAEHVCVLEDEALDVLDVLAHLVDKSLVIMDSSAGEARYRMLETTRQYAREKVLASEEGEELGNRHRDWYFKLAERGKKELGGHNQLEWLHRLDGELDNLRAALEWSFAASQPETVAIQMVNNLAEFWDMHGYGEASFWLKRAMENSCTQMGTPIRAKVLYHYGYNTVARRGNWKDGRPLLEESLELFRTLGESHRVDRAYTQVSLGFYLYNQNHEHETGHAYMQEAINIFQDAGERRGQGWALQVYSVVRFNEGDVKTAFAMAKEGAALYRSCGDRYGEAICVETLGLFDLGQGTYHEAIRYLEEALEVFREFGKNRSSGMALENLGEAYRGLDEYDKAEACYRQSLSIFQNSGIGSYWFFNYNLNLGYTVLYRGDDEEAVSFFKEALVLSREDNNRRRLAHCLGGFAAVAAARGDAEDSALLYGAMDSQIQILLADGDKLDYLIQSVDRREIERYQALCRARLGDSAFETARRRGRAMTLDAAIAFALERINC